MTRADWRGGFVYGKIKAMDPNLEKGRHGRGKHGQEGPWAASARFGPRQRPAPVGAAIYGRLPIHTTIDTAPLQAGQAGGRPARGAAQGGRLL